MKFLISLGAGCKKEKELQAVRKVLSSCWQKRIYLRFQKGVVRYHQTIHLCCRNTLTLSFSYIIPFHAVLPIINFLYFTSKNDSNVIFSNIERTRTCSSIRNRTQTPYFWLRTIEHRTSNIVRPITSKNKYDKMFGKLPLIFPNL